MIGSLVSGNEKLSTGYSLHWRVLSPDTNIYKHTDTHKLIKIITDNVTSPEPKNKDIYKDFLAKLRGWYEVMEPHW